MTLSTTLAIYLGVVIESLWLWDAASPKFDRSDRTGFAVPRPSTTVTLIGISAAVGMALIGLAEWIGETPFTDGIHSVLESALMGATMFFVLIAGAVGGRLLPRVSEYNVASVLAIVALNAATQRFVLDPLLAVALIGLSLVIAGALVVQRSAPTPAAQVILYLFYLGALSFLTLQSGILDAMRQTRFTLPEAFVFGSTFTFLVLHLLFGIRFLVFASSLILPANRIYARPMMAKLFRDDQLAPVPFLLILAGALVAVALNHYLDLFPSDTFATVVVMLCTQLFFRSAAPAERGEGVPVSEIEG
jgi:hypothetical protein